MTATAATAARATARVECAQPFRGPGDHRLGQVDADYQAVGADPVGGLKQRGAGAAGHVEHPHSRAHASVGHQPSGDLVQEPGRTWRRPGRTGR
jgi:hypothetical protein